MANAESRKGARGDQPYTIDRALTEAAEMLQSQFGEADQQAAVQLAGFLYSSHERDEFIRHERERPRAAETA